GYPPSTLFPYTTLFRSTRRNAQWMTAHEAEKTARTSSERIVDLVRRGYIQGRFLSLGRNGRTECWIRRESFNQWIVARDAELARSEEHTSELQSRFDLV